MHRKLLLLSFLFFLAGRAAIYAQSSSDQDCITAIPVCQPFYQQTNSYVGTGSAYPAELTLNNQGCLGSGERNDVWYVINVTSSGILELTITPVNLADDYDFAVWDITGVGCNAIYNYSTYTANAYLPIGCNYSGTPGATGLSNTITGSQWSSGLSVTAGQTLVLNVSNFSSTASGYSLNFVANTSGISIYDTVPPKVTSIVTHCQFPSDTLTLTTSEPVKCNSITGGATEWTIVPAAGGATPVAAIGVNCSSAANSATTTIKLILAAPLPPGNYQLHLANGSDNNTLLDNCGNPAKDSLYAFTILSPDPPTIVQIDTPACNKARLHFSRSIKCSTVAPDGSDFRITGPGAVTVLRAAPIACTSVGTTDVVDVFFTTSIFTPGNYTISVITGSDGNGITDTCSVAVAAPASFFVSDQGYIEATALPGILCYPGYIGLVSTVSIPPPPMTVGCGDQGTVCSGAPSDYIVGNPTATGSTAATPLYGSTIGARSQMLFRASELRAAGLTNGIITQISLSLTARLSAFPYSNFSLKIGCTGANSLTDFIGALPEVYNTSTFTPVVGINTFPFTTNYNWDGTSNIVVEMCYDNGGSTSGNDPVPVTTGLFAGAFLQVRSNTNGCALTLNSAAPLISASRPNLIFTECTPPTAASHTFLWTPGAFVRDSSAQNTYAYAPASRVFQIQIMDSNYCYRRDTAGVIVSVRTPAVSHDTSICIGDRIGISAAGGDAGGYQWYPTNGLSCTTCPNPVASPTATTTYNAVITDVYGCSDTLQTKVTVFELPVVRVAMKDTAIIYGIPGQLFAFAGGTINYYWSPSAGLNDNLIPNPKANPTTTTHYVVTVTDTNHCRNSDTELVRVRTDVPLFIPSAFTPNGDGHNDIFGVVNLTFQRVTEFRVFNRWGQEVFSTQDSHHGWDGTFNGQNADAGVYQYLIRVAWPDGRSERYKGDVTLVR